MSQIISVTMARPSEDEVKSLWQLFHATEAVEDRWNRESSEQFLERLNDQDVSDEERAFIAIAWDSLVQGYGGFGRFIGAYETLIYNFQDPDADHVAIHPKFNALLAESALLPMVLEGYTDARNSIVEIENERNAALNTCTLIAEALGITGAVAGDTIAQVQQLVGENAELKANARAVAINAADNIAYAIFNLSDKTLDSLMPGISDTTCPTDSALIAERDLRQFAARMRGNS
ncbi:hypothetical protein [Yersinia pseudotuberculosis]